MNYGCYGIKETQINGSDRVVIVTHKTEEAKQAFSNVFTNLVVFDYKDEELEKYVKCARRMRPEHIITIL